MEEQSERSTFEELQAFAKDIFGLELPTLDVMPLRNDLAWLREHGEYFDDVRVVPFGDPKGCYKNASDYTWEDVGREYVQGFVLWRGLIYGHAWCVDENGPAEVTWPRVEGRYFGVRFSLDQLAKLALKFQTYDWYEGFADVLNRKD